MRSEKTLPTENASNPKATKKVSNYIFECLAKSGVDRAFVITGGGAMHLNDALGRCEGISYTCCHHEQACAMAAESYARVTGKPAVVSVTTGPGGVNALNGVFGAWTDSIPMIIVSGQVKRETCLGTTNTPGLRQLGDQEVDIIRMCSGITKYAVLVSDPEDVRYHVEKAIYLANSGRPGPVWLDIPIDVQSSLITPETQRRFNPDDEPPLFSEATVREQVATVIERIKNAKRPVLMVGSGVHLAKANKVFEAVIEKLGIPVLTAFTAPDLLATDHPLFCGRPSTVGDRAGNFVAQNSDLLLVIGCKLNIRQISYNWKMFARSAFKIQVDIDPIEMQKPTVQIDMPITADAKFFLEELDRQLGGDGAGSHGDWVAWGKERLARYPAVLERHRQAPKGMINPYYFASTVFDHLNDSDVVVCGDGTACVVSFQTAKIKQGQRLFSNSGAASMGYDLPSAIGAAVARGSKERVICFAGDGSIQMNIQELQTIVHHQFPVKIFMLNNDGYLSIRQTQDAYFGLRVGEGPTSGVTFPDIVKVSSAYGINSRRWTSADEAIRELPEVLASSEPELVEVMLDPSQVFEPKLASKQLSDGRMYSAPLEDLAPFLPPEELRENMIIPIAEE